MSQPLILMYHQVDRPRSKREHRFCTPPDEFNYQMAWLIESGYTAVGLNDMVSYVSNNGDLPDKAVHITFDDGFIGVLEHAFPALKKHGIPATLFALSGRTGATNDWMWQRGFPQRPLLSREQLRMLAEEGMVIGSHTRTHAKLTEISIDQAKSEIVDSKKELEDIIGKEVAHFAYPYGLFNSTVRDLIEHAGYSSACSTRSGFNRIGEDKYLLRRIDVFGTDRLWQFRQKLRFGVNEATRLKPLAYYANRIVSKLGMG